MNIYNSKTGMFRFTDLSFSHCYSGTGKGRNNPAMEAVKAVGPIPRGMWLIIGVKDSVNTGPYSLILEPVEHDAHGRSLFRIHGDNKEHDASHGCIIMSPLELRRKIWQSGDHSLRVE